MTAQLWNKWIEDWNWILEIARQRNWDTYPLIIKSAVEEFEIERLEVRIKNTLPTEFKIILTNYSAEVKMGWQIQNEKTVGEFRGIFCGCGGVSEYRTNSYLWSFDKLEQLYETYLSWLKDCYSDPNDQYGKHYYDKIPFIEVPNGDLIVFDKNGQVIYLSHDDGPLHGSKLADNFIEFITLWSNVGCVGTESEQFLPFYNKDKNKFQNSDSGAVIRWKEWLISRRNENGPVAKEKF